MTMVLYTVSSWTQENLLTLSGGYVFTNLEETDVNASGWRINALYEFNPNEGMVAHGLSFGYIGTKAESTVQNQTSEYKLNTWPIYYAPKLMFGSDKLKGFIKGALGVHFSSYKRTGALGEIDVNDVGFYGGVSLGGMVNLSDKVFINVEYEWVYMANSMYKNGFMNSVMAGLGFRL
jgi:hypothetical protein